MRKIRLGMATVVCAAITLQTCMLNTTSPQISEGVDDSKRNGFFVAELNAESSYDLLVIEEAWVEKVWFNDRSGMWYTKTPIDACQLCFKVKQIPGAGFSLDSFGHWMMREKATDNFVGIKASKTANSYKGTYVCGMKSCAVPDSIEFDLLINPTAEFMYPNDKNNKSVGRLVFKRK